MSLPLLNKEAQLQKEYNQLLALVKKAQGLTAQRWSMVGDQLLPQPGILPNIEGELPATKKAEDFLVLCQTCPAPQWSKRSTICITTGPQVSDTDAPALAIWLQVDVQGKFEFFLSHNLAKFRTVDLEQAVAFKTLCDQLFDNEYSELRVLLPTTLWRVVRDFL